ncbi:MAG: hypothetical protein DRJ64_07770 [Thermoprotei archaeon]|nr:MAG: hypothetical protein DRJ64_07770 [Thermoprotei archaeon]
MDRMERIDRETVESNAGKMLRLTITADNSPYVMKPTEHSIIAITALADAAAIITLPSLQEAMGQFYYICAPTGATAGDISVYEKETGAEFSTYGDLDADDDHVLLFSDGLKWRVVLDGVA